MDRTIPIKAFPEISILDENEVLESHICVTEKEEGLYTVKLNVKGDQLAAPRPITLRWKMPALNVKGTWKCGGQHDKRLQYDWELDHLKSRVSIDAPIVTVFGHVDVNVVTFVCDDAVNLVELNALLREEDSHLYCHITFFSERHPEIDNYEAEIKIDTRPTNYTTSIKDAVEWWSQKEAYKPTSVPDLARLPMYSTWYQFHQDLDRETIIKECKIARTLGYELIIIDDGWQTMDNNRGYDYTGDWNPDRFPDMAEFVKEVHDTGMKIGIWFSVPFCGKKSKAYQEFKGKFLTENHRWAPVFDPRYPEVREYLIGKYTRAISDWGLDALKLDFIDDFRVYPDTPLTLANGRDYANVNQAVYRLLSDANTALTAIRPDIAIEFRQKYIGPAMRSFGNMFRAFDCPNDPVSNRIRTTDVKLLCGDSAPHSDMLKWHFDEKVEHAALQMLNGIFAVPQMSIMLHEAPEDHVKMVKFYTQYWKENREVLLDGQFEARNPLGNYPILSSQTDNHLIVGVFDRAVADVRALSKIDILNGSMSSSVAIRNLDASALYNMKTYDCMGYLKSEGIITLNSGLLEILVDPAGLIKLNRIKS